MKEYINIGKLDKSKISNYAKKIITDEVVLTNERLKHILDNHKKDFELYFNNAKEIIEQPDYILEDIKNINTVMFIKHIQDTNINNIVRLAVGNDNKHPKNSIMTFYRLRNSNLRKMVNKNKTIYKNE